MKHHYHHHHHNDDGIHTLANVEKMSRFFSFFNFQFFKKRRSLNGQYAIGQMMMMMTVVVDHPHTHYPFTVLKIKFYLENLVVKKTDKENDYDGGGEEMNREKSSK